MAASKKPTNPLTPVVLRPSPEIRGSGPPAEGVRPTPSQERAALDLELEDLLWGKPEAPSSPQAPDRKRDSNRRACSFPGLLRILVPELTFNPYKLAVRVVDLSVQGARLETRQLTPEMAKALGEEPRHVRLEAMVQGMDRKPLAGVLAWVQREEQISRLGLHFREPHPELSSLFFPADVSTVPPRVTLPSPILNAFPSLTSQPVLTLTGVAPKASHVEVHCGDRSFEAPTQEERFSVNVPLEKDRPNQIRVIGNRDGEVSLPTPILIVHRTGARDTITVEHCDMIRELSVDRSGELMRLTLEARGGEMIAVLRALEETLEFADHCSLTFELTGDAHKATERITNRLSRFGVARKALADVLDSMD